MATGMIRRTGAARDEAVLVYSFGAWCRTVGTRRVVYAAALDAALQHAASARSLGGGAFLWRYLFAWRHEARCENMGRRFREATVLAEAVSSTTPAVARTRAQACDKTSIVAVLTLANNRQVPFRHLCVLAWRRHLAARAEAWRKATEVLSGMARVAASWHRLRVTIACWRQTAHSSALLRWRYRARGLALLRVVVGTWRMTILELRYFSNGNGPLGRSQASGVVPPTRNAATPRSIPWRGGPVRQQTEEKTPATPQRRSSRPAAVRPLGVGGAGVTETGAAAATGRWQRCVPDSASRRALSAGSAAGSSGALSRVAPAARASSTARASPRPGLAAGAASGSTITTAAKRAPSRPSTRTGASVGAVVGAGSSGRRPSQPEPQQTRVAVIELGGE